MYARQIWCFWVCRLENAKISISEMQRIKNLVSKDLNFVFCVSLSPEYTIILPIVYHAEIYNVIMNKFLPTTISAIFGGANFDSFTPKKLQWFSDLFNHRAAINQWYPLHILCNFILIIKVVSQSCLFKSILNAKSIQHCWTKQFLWLFSR